MRYANGGKEEGDDVELMTALFYCFKLKRKKSRLSSEGEEEENKKAAQADKDANLNGAIGNDHLEVFDKLALKL